MIFEGIYRRFTALRGGKAPLDARFTHLESLAVGQVEPTGYEMTRAGRRFAIGYSGGPTGIAPVQAIPTTAAQWAIWNGDLLKSYVFKLLGVFPAAGTPGVGGQLLMCYFTAPISLLPQATNLALVNLSNSAIGTKAIVKSGVTITSPSAPVWTPIAENLSPNVGAFPGSGLILNRELNGRVILPPQTGLGFAALALAGTTPLFAPLAEWVEAESDLE